MSRREVVALGTASQVPTRGRAHHALFVRVDDIGLLVDPGEGAQRQLLLAGIPSSAITAICLTHLHGDHCLGLPGVVQLLSLDEVRHPVPILYPVEGQEYVDRLLRASIFEERAEVVPVPVSSPGQVTTLGREGWQLSAQELAHRVPCIGWRLDEPSKRRFLPDRLDELGVRGPMVRRLSDEGTIEVEGRVVRLEDVSEVRPGQSVAVAMDTAECDGARVLCDGADLAVIESTFLSSAGQEELARISGHLTARQAARLAVEVGVRRLVLTHFSRRHPSVDAFRAEAAEHHDDVHAARDLDVIALPPPRGSRV